MFPSLNEPCLSFNSIRHTIKGKNKKFYETKQASEPDSDVAQMLELVYREFEITLPNILRTLIENVDNVQEHMGNINREKEIPRQN